MNEHFEIDIIKLYNFIRDNKKVFLTGAGGTGKSFITRQLIQICRAPIVLGSTGIAASNIGGDTIHSFFKLGLCSNVQELEAYTETKLQDMARRLGTTDNLEYIYFSYLSKCLGGSDMIIIDEVSMMSDHLYDMIIFQMRKLGFWGRIPILFVGDLYQLPPVNKKGAEIKADFIFNHPEWQGTKTLDLQEIRRTGNTEFAEVQKKVRVGICDSQVRAFLNTFESRPVAKQELRLMPTNSEVDQINQARLNELDSKPYRSVPNVLLRDKFVTDKQYKSFLSDVKVAEELIFKVGAKVIFIINSQVGFFNGEMGEIISLDNTKKCIMVKSLFKLDTIYEVVRESFVRYKITPGANGKPVMNKIIEVAAYPFKLGYAITIHKSQGMTLASGVVECNRIFEPQQFYVALSRFSSPSNVSLRNFNATKHIVKNPYIDNFYASCDRVDLGLFAKDQAMPNIDAILKPVEEQEYDSIELGDEPTQGKMSTAARYDLESVGDESDLPF